MTKVGAEKVAGNLVGIGEIAVMGERDAVGGVHIKRLCFSRTGRAGGRVAHMTDAVITDQPHHVARMKHIAHHAILLAEIKPAVMGCHNAGGILTAMLQYRQCVIEVLVNRALACNTHNTAHNSPQGCLWSAVSASPSAGLTCSSCPASFAACTTLFFSSRPACS